MINFSGLCWLIGETEGGYGVRLIYGKQQPKPWRFPLWNSTEIQTYTSQPLYQTGPVSFLKNLFKLIIYCRYRIRTLACCCHPGLIAVIFSSRVKNHITQDTAVCNKSWLKLKVKTHTRGDNKIIFTSIYLLFSEGHHIESRFCYGATDVALTVTPAFAGS